MEYFYFKDNLNKRYSNVTMNNVQDQVVIDQLVAIKKMNFHVIDQVVEANLNY